MNIETQIAEEKIGILLTFWSTVVTLKELSSSRVFSKYILKSKDTPVIPDGWELGSYTFPNVTNKKLKEGESISKVVDNLGNIYYEITDVINT